MFRQKGVTKLTFEEEYDPVDIEDYLAHYGRKGMKWYQHIFGRLQGHAKYAKEKAVAKRSEKVKKKDKTEKNYKKISDEELKRRISRLRNEKEYLDLTRASRRAGQRAAIAVLDAIGKGSLRVIEDQTRTAGNKLVGQIISELEKQYKEDKKKK